jgi:hypothetical protein
VAAVAFTKNYRDRSTDTSFRFEFFCDRSYGYWVPSWLSLTFPESCTYSYKASAQPYPRKIARTVQAAASWLSGKAGEVVSDVNKEAWNAAFNSAVDEARKHFRFCPSCKKWVCKQSCWNEKAGLCQICNRIKTTVDAIASSTTRSVCSSCGEIQSGGKFCAVCGKARMSQIFCANCGENLGSAAAGLRFCPNCGDQTEIPGSAR